MFVAFANELYDGSFPTLCNHLVLTLSVYCVATASIIRTPKNSSQYPIFPHTSNLQFYVRIRVFTYNFFLFSSARLL